jgi:hypothetical protein
MRSFSYARCLSMGIVLGFEVPRRPTSGESTVIVEIKRYGYAAVRTCQTQIYIEVSPLSSCFLLVVGAYTRILNYGGPVTLMEWRVEGSHAGDECLSIMGTMIGWGRSIPMHRSWTCTSISNLDAVLQVKLLYTLPFRDRENVRYIVKPESRVHHCGRLRRPLKP